MTFVGKILVIVIMAFALLFLGISTVVFTTHTNWKEATAKEKTKVNDLQKLKTELDAKLATATTDLDKAKSDYKTERDAAAKRAADLEDANKRDLAEVTAVRSKQEEAIQSAKTALSEADERRKETDRLREQKAAVEKQANEYKLQQTELNDKIRELERMNNTLDENNKRLRDSVAKFQSLLRQNGLSDDITTISTVGTPPPVRGEVKNIDRQNRRVEVTIGSDDGLVRGHELFLFREKPFPEYLGKIKIESVDPDQAVGIVIGSTVNGKKIQAGDVVSSKIRR